jgi:hypothetical protein
MSSPGTRAVSQLGGQVFWHQHRIYAASSGLRGHAFSNQLERRGRQINLDHQISSLPWFAIIS